MSTTEKTKTQSRKRRRSTSPAYTKSKTTKAEAARVIAEHQKMISYMLKAEDPIWGDLKDDDEEYNKFFKTTKTNKNGVKKRKVTNYKSTSTSPSTSPLTLPSISPSPSPSPIQSFTITADIIRNVIHAIGLHDITDINNISIMYTGDYEIAHIFALVEYPIGFHIMSDMQLFELLSEEEQVFVKFLNKELMTVDSSIKLNTLVSPEAVKLKRTANMANARAVRLLKIGNKDAAAKASADADNFQKQFEEYVFTNRDAYIAANSKKRITYKRIFLKDLIGKVLTI